MVLLPKLDEIYLILSYLILGIIPLFSLAPVVKISEEVIVLCLAIFALTGKHGMGYHLFFHSTIFL